ncbi:MAG: GAF domain-containing sensor histidine kinase, partial [Candidatus Cloacimonetes bacterium]|nr:GAF domain-containing sensor histidine kinase [Candidatus Cloacimonadota bacterium]
IKTAEVGCLIMADNGELAFQDSEKAIMEILRLHLTSILMRINEFAGLNKDMELMTKLIEITRKFFTILNVEKLEQEIVAFTLDFTDGSRGFLIRKDRFENYLYKVAMDDSKHLLKSYAYISKSVLSEVQRTKQPVFYANAVEEKVFEGYIDFKSESLIIYCAPLIVENEIYGFLYLDNYNAPENSMIINPDFMKLLLTQISSAFKNAQQYEILIQKSREIASLDDLKKDFINIVSHELKTPLVTLHGYVNRIKKIKFPKKEKEVISTIKNSVDKLYLTINDILNFNKYQMLKELDKDFVNIKSLLTSLRDEAEKISADRHMIVKLEVEDRLKNVQVNWNALYLLVFNIILNAIRFTKDFGTIIIGARRSTFQQEEIEGKESLVIYVQDNGIGIPEYELQRIFQKFYELGDIISHSSGLVEFKSSGLGLGLSTAKLITELHNGKIWINSKENEGTTVFIAIPYLK